MKQLETPGPVDRERPQMAGSVTSRQQRKAAFGRPGHGADGQLPGAVANWQSRPEAEIQVDPGLRSFAPGALPHASFDALDQCQRSR